MADELQPPIILLGNVRSGTTMLHDFFDMVPGVKSWFEPRTVWLYADPGRRHDRFTAEDATPRVKAYIRKRFLQRQRRFGARVMEKTPSNVMRVPYVHEIFPESKLLYVVREPLAHVSSAEYRWRNAINMNHLKDRLFETPTSQLHYYAYRVLLDHWRRKVLRRKHVSIYGTRYPGVYDDLRAMPVEQVIAKQWVEGSRQCDEDLAKLDPSVWMKIRYEDFVTDPVSTFGEILEFFGLESTPELDAALAEKTDPGRREKWKRLDPNEVRTFLPILVDEMRRQGYEVPESFLEANAAVPA